MQQLFPEFRSRVDPYSIYDEIQWEPLADRPYVALNMVSTMDGRATMAGRVKEIGSDLDHYLMKKLRVTVDAVLRGAGTVRSNPVFPGVPSEMVPMRLQRGLSPQPRLIIISGSLNLDWQQRFITDAPEQPIVLTTELAEPDRLRAAQAWAEVHIMGKDQVSIPASLRLLRHRYGIRHLLSEGGPVTNAAFLAADLLDEFFWTVAPKIGGGSSDLASVESAEPLPVRHFQLVSVFLQESELFLRYRRRRGS